MVKWLVVTDRLDNSAIQSFSYPFIFFILCVYRQEFPFSALTPLVGQQKGHLACKKLVPWGTDGRLPLSDLDLDLGSGHTAYRRASLIDLYLHTKFH